MDIYRYEYIQDLDVYGIYQFYIEQDMKYFTSGTNAFAKWRENVYGFRLQLVVKNASIFLSFFLCRRFSPSSLF